MVIKMNLEDIEINRDPVIIFMGTPIFAVPVLKALIKKVKINAIVTQPDRKKNKDGKVIISPVKQVGIDNTILVLQPENIKKQYEEVLSLNPDLIITCAYGQILPKEIIDYPRLGVVNIHASLLPKLRGSAPIHHAIIDGYTKTGITLMYSTVKMDDGDIIKQEEIDILSTDTASSLHDKLSSLSAKMIIESLDDILSGNTTRIVQNDLDATYAPMIKREDEKIDFKKSKKAIFNQVRGLNSWPGSYCLYEGKILKVWECYCTNNNYSYKLDGEITNIYKDGFGVKVSNGEIVLTIVQPEGKKIMKATDFINGEKNKKDVIGKVLE